METNEIPIGDQDTEEEEVDEGMQKHSQSVKNGKNECIKRPVSASKTCFESATLMTVSSTPHLNQHH